MPKHNFSSILDSLGAHNQSLRARSLVGKDKLAPMIDFGMSKSVVEDKASGKKDYMFFNDCCWAPRNQSLKKRPSGENTLFNV